MTTQLAALSAEYLAGLRAYLEHEGEAGLTRAYELGRRALTEGVGLLDMAALHYTSLDSLVLPAPERASLTALPPDDPSLVMGG